MTLKRKTPHTSSSQANPTTKTRTRQKRLNFRVWNKEDEDEDSEDLYSASDNEDEDERLVNDIEEEEQYTLPNKPPLQPISQQSSLPSINIQPQLDFANTSSRIVFKAPPQRKESHEPQSYV